MAKPRLHAAVTRVAIERAGYRRPIIALGKRTAPALAPCHLTCTLHPEPRLT